MTVIEASCTLQGEAYSPSLAEQWTKVSFREKNEPGETGWTGRYKGKPVPFGSSKLEPPVQATRENSQAGIEWLANVVVAHRRLFEAAGASEIELRLNVTHDGQCNLAFPSHLLETIALSKLNLVISCHEDAEYVAELTEAAEKEKSR